MDDSITNYSVLSYIFGDYELVREVKEKSRFAEYILVTDNPNIKSDTWTVIYDPALNGLSPFDKCCEVRTHPFKYCKTDLCVRVDGSMELYRCLDPIVSQFLNGGYDLSLVIHPVRN